MSSHTALVYPRQAPISRPGVRALLLGAGVAIVGTAVLTGLALELSPIPAGLGVIGVLIVIGMFASPDFAVLVLCASLPFERIGRLTDDADPVAISASRILGVLALVSLMLHMALRREKPKFGVPFWLYAGYTGVSLVGNAWAWSPEETYRESFHVLGNLLFFFQIVNAVRTYAFAKTVILVWLLASVAAGAFSVSDYYLSSRASMVTSQEMGLTSERRATVLDDGAESRALGTNVKRLFGPTAHPTLFGLNMLMTVPFLLWIQRTARGWLHILWPAGLVVAGFSIILSNTRAVLLLAGATVVMCFWRRLWRPSLQSAAALLLIVLSVTPFIPEDVYRRTFDPALYTLTGADGLRVRLKFWGKSWEIIQQTWWHGIGVGNQTAIVDMITDETTGNLTPEGHRASAHNEYIWVMAESGLVGYLFFWGFVGFVTAAGFRAAARFRQLPDARDEYVFSLACQVLTMGCLLFAVQSESFHYPLKGWWLTAALGVVMLDLARARFADRETAPRPAAVRI